MLIDFHYYTIKVLCSYAGMTDAQAQSVAYASQYVDDSVDHSKIYLSRPLRKPKYARYSSADMSFDPICTAHKGINIIRGMSHEAQVKVYVPFHFLPAEQYLCQKEYGYRTAPDSTFARELLDWAIDPLRREPTERALIKAGIAIHTFADTWAHQNFSGRYSQHDNTIDAIWLDSDGTWERVAPIKVALGNLAPDIGHVEAFKYPDLSYLKWKYSGGRGEIVRDNTEEFLKASEAIYRQLISALGTIDRWSEFSRLLEHCFRAKEDKPAVYAKTFPAIAFSYDSKQWRDEALAEDASAHDRLEPLEGKKWFKFHEEAYEQRLFVMNRILLF